MSIFDELVAAMTPPESEEARVEARRKVEATARPGDWLSQILDHHRGIEAQFVALKAATDVVSRRGEQKKLAELLTGHAIAEEAAVYPALAWDHQTGHAGLAYQEQSAAKMEMGLLERLDPMSDDWTDKVGHIEGAVAHHVYSEEGTWFLKLAESASPEEQALIATRYAQEYARYMGGVPR